MVSCPLSKIGGGEMKKKKDYCQCKEKPVRLISHCRNCGKEIENPPTIKEMLNEKTMLTPNGCYYDKMNDYFVNQMGDRYIKT